MPKNWWKMFIDGLSDFFERLGSEKNVEILENILKLILIGCQIAEKFNAPLSGSEKAAFVRLLVRAVKYSTPDEIDSLANLLVACKGSGDVDSLQSWEIDKLLGDGIALFLSSIDTPPSDSVCDRVGG